MLYSPGIDSVARAARLKVQATRIDSSQAATFTHKSA
jgi:hypothetical protein